MTTPRGSAQRRIADAVTDDLAARLYDDLAPLVDEDQARAIARRQVADLTAAGWAITIRASTTCCHNPKDRP